MIMPPIPPMLTAEAVRARMAERSIGMAEAKAQLLRERLLVSIQAFDLTGDRKLLSSILFQLAELVK